MLFLRGSKIEYGSRTVQLAVILCSFVNDIFGLRSQVQKTMWVWGLHKLKPDILNSLKMINFARNLSKQLQLHSAVWPPAGAIKKNNTHEGKRTPNLWFRRPTPYPLGHAGWLETLRYFLCKKFTVEEAYSWFPSHKSGCETGWLHYNCIVYTVQNTVYPVRKAIQISAIEHEM